MLFFYLHSLIASSYDSNFVISLSSERTEWWFRLSSCIMVPLEVILNRTFFHYTKHDTCQWSPWGRWEEDSVDAPASVLFLPGNVGTQRKSQWQLSGDVSWEALGLLEEWVLMHGYCFCIQKRLLMRWTSKAKS